MKCRFISIVGTTECDAHCSFCNRWHEPIVSMDVDLTCNLIDQLPGLKTKIIDITGGQPGLWEGTIPVLRRCKENLLRTTVTVSGPSAFNLLESVALIRYLRVSVHGTPDNHDRFQGAGFWDANREFLKAVVNHYRNHLPELIFTVRNEHTKDDFEAVDQLARQFGIRIIGNLEWGLVPQRRILNLIHGFRIRPYWVFSLAKIRYWLSGGNNSSDPTCAANQMLTLYDNSIVQPCMEHRDLLPSISLDHSSRLEDIISSRKQQSWYTKTGRWDFCQDCIISCPNSLGLVINCWRRYASWLHMPTLLQGPRDRLLLTVEKITTKRT